MRFHIFIIPAVLFLAGCGGGGSSSSGSGSTSSITGTVSAGPLNGATVTAYSLNPDGTQGSQLGTTTTDSNGNFTLTASAQSGSLEIVATGGRYTEEGSGSTISMGSAKLRLFLPSVTASQTVGITAATEISAQNVLTAISANSTSTLASLISSSNAAVSAAMGIADITIPPANPTIQASSASSTSAAQYAVVLAAMSQMAKTASTSTALSINSLDVMQALAISFSYSGSFATTVTTGSGATGVPVPNGSNSALTLSTVLTAAGGATFSSAMSAATTTYLSSAGAIALGYNNTTAVPTITYTTAPGTPSGQVAITPPAPPISLPSTQPISSGSPALPSAPIISFTSGISATVKMAITAATPISSGTVITSCSVSSPLPAGLSLNTTTCAISGTPTAVTTATTFTVTATDAANASGFTTISVAVNNTAPTGLSYSTPTAVYTLGSAITANSPSNIAGVITSYSILPTSLPTGLSFNTSTGVISGTPTAQVGATSYTVTGSNSISSTTATVSIATNYPIPPDATNFIATDYDYYSLSLSWTAQSSPTYFQGYRYVYQSGSTAPANCNSGTGVSVGNTTSAVVTGLSSGTEYAFRLCAYYGSNDTTTLYSTGATATITTPTAHIAISVSAGGFGACALTSAGTVYCWGGNQNGQMGINSLTNDFDTPQQVVSTSGSGALSNITAISAGMETTCALNSSGNVYCWGNNIYGTVGNGNTTSTTYPSEVVGVGGTGVLSNITAISVGSCQVCALNTSGNVYCWGDNANGQLGNGSTTNSSSPVEVKGLNGTGFLSSVTAISSGGVGIYGRNCALSGENVYCWGSSYASQSPGSPSLVPWEVIGTDGVNPLANITAVSVGSSNDCYVNSAGNVFCNGDDLYGEWGSNFVATVNYNISSNVTTTMEAHGLLNSGDLSGVGTLVAGLDNIFAITGSGAVYGWGSNANGVLGIGSTTEQNVPITSGFTNVSSFSAGTNFSFACAVNTSGAVYCAGYNVNSELGNNTSGGTYYSPVGVYGFY